MADTRQKASIEKTEALCKWWLEHAGAPSMSAKKGTEERKLAVWLSRRRYAYKKGKKIPDAEKSVLDSYGLTGLFNVSATQLRSEDLSSLYKMWCSIHKREPGASEEDDLGQMLYRWITRKRTGETKIYEGDKKELGVSVPNLYERLSREQLSNYMAHSLCQWIKENGRNPRRLAEDGSEAQLANWLANKRQGLKGRVQVRVYDSDIAIFKQYGFTNLF